MRNASVMLEKVVPSKLNRHGLKAQTDLLMQASCSPVTNDVRSICLGCGWVVKLKGMKTSAYTSLQVLNDGTEPTSGIDKDYQNGFTAT